MNIKHLTLTLAALAACGSATTAGAQSFTFNGTRQNVNPLSPPGSGRCAPTFFNTVTIAPGALSSTGTSNIESFTSTQSHCITSAPPTSVVDGQFTYTFRGGDSISGTYTGNVAAGAGGLTGTENLVITGGTGRFVGASGTLVSTGALSTANGLGNFSGTVTGSLVATTATASGSFATALGAPSAATGGFSTALGAFSLASGLNSLAGGSFADAIGEGAVALGDNAFASALASTALGQDSTATGIASSAIGHNTNATGLGATAVGVRAQSTGIGSTAVGRLSGATADTATALGANAQATFAGSTAIGAGAATTAVNQVSLGGTGSAVRVGDIAASTAAQTAASVGVATVDAGGVLGRNTTLLPAVAAMQGQVDTLFDLRDVDRRDTRQGIAAAVAIGQAPMPSAAGKTTYVLNGANFRGEQAIGGSVMHRLATSTPFAISASFGFAGNKNNTARIGVAGEF